MNIEQLLTLSRFDGVAFTNNTFNKPPIDKADPSYWKKLESQYKIILEEAQETVEAAEDSNHGLLRDACCDVDVTVLGLIHLMGSTEIKWFPDLEWDIATAAARLNHDRHGVNEIRWDMIEAWAADLIIDIEGIGEGIAKRDEKLIKDAIRSTYHTLVAIMANSGINLIEDMKKVLVSNISKVCKTEEDAQKTIKHYMDTEGVELEAQPCPTFPGFIVVSAKDQRGRSGKNYPKGKFLKCVVSFQEPKFD